MSFWSGVSKTAQFHVHVLYRSLHLQHCTVAMLLMASKDHWNCMRIGISINNLRGAHFHPFNWSAVVCTTVRDFPLAEPFKIDMDQFLADPQHLFAPFLAPCHSALLRTPWVSRDSVWKDVLSVLSPKRGGEIDPNTLTLRQLAGFIRPDLHST